MDLASSGTNQDYLNEFKAISNKLKKRFLRRPNVAEASEQFARLAKRLRDNEEPHYEASCHLAVSRCEQSIGNTSGEVEALVSAARAFLKAEMNLKQVGGPSFQENLLDSLDSFCNAIRILEETGDTVRASGLCLELGNALWSVGKSGEAASFYQRAADLRSDFVGLEYVHARQKVASCLIDVGDHHNALLVLTDIANVTEQLAGKPVPTSVYLDILEKCEILRILLLLLIEPSTPQSMPSSVTNVLEKYAWESASDAIAVDDFNIDPSAHDKRKELHHQHDQQNHYLSDEKFLLLQSIVMAVQLRDCNALTKLEDHLVPLIASEPQQRDLLRLLVKSMREKSN